MSDEYGGWRFHESAPGHGYHASHRAVEGERPAEPERRVIRKADAVEPGRLRRAAHLAVKRIGPRQFLVQGQTEPAYTVDLGADQRCWCRDQEYRGGRIAHCKHILAAMMASGDMRIINALAALYEPQVRAEREMGLTDKED